MANPVEYFQYLTQLKSTRIVSIDVFDTLLLRKPNAEGTRFYQIALLHSKYFKQHHQIIITANEILLARLEATQTIYRTKTPLFGAREAHIEEIYLLLFQLLKIKLNPTMLDDLISLELNYELTELTANHALVKVLKHAKKSGKKIVCTSDMYLSSDHIKYLIAHTVGDITDKIISSADYGYGKSCGQLFIRLSNLFNSPLNTIVHCGDNYWADITVPISHNIKCSYTPRKMYWKLLKTMHTLHFNYQLKKL